MKTIPVSLIVAGILTPVLSLAQPQRGPDDGPPRDGDGRKGPRGHADFWKLVDKDQDGSLSKAEFDMMPRIQGLPEEKRLSLFQRLDKDGDGEIARGELAGMGKPRDGDPPPMQRFWELDEDKSGGISLQEFKAGRVFKKLPPERQDELFKRLDTDQDGLITPKDKPEPPFKRDGGDNRPKRPEGGKPDGKGMDPRQMIRQLDQNGDGALSFEEFRAGPAVKNLSEDEQEDRFEAIDKNQDLKITPEDFPPPPNHRGGPGGPGGPPPDRD
jgi:Ca2+-binding EF-hand superfamily protein